MSACMYPSQSQLCQSNLSRVRIRRGVPYRLAPYRQLYTSVITRGNDCQVIFVHPTAVTVSKMNPIGRNIKTLPFLQHNPDFTGQVFAGDCRGTQCFLIDFYHIANFIHRSSPLFKRHGTSAFCTRMCGRVSLVPAKPTIPNGLCFLHTLIISNWSCHTDSSISSQSNMFSVRVADHQIASP